MRKSSSSTKSLPSQMILFLKACLTGIALCTDLQVSDVEWAGIHHSLLNMIYTLLEQLQQGLSEDSGLLVTILILGLFAVYRKLWYEKAATPVHFSRGLSVFLSIMHTGSYAFYCDDSLSILWRYKINLLRTLILLVGLYWFYLFCVNVFYLLLHSGLDLRSSDNRLLHLYQKHPWISVWFVMVLCWLPHVVLHYPGIMSYDNYNQLLYYYGYKTYTTAQPIFHTWFFSTFVDAGVALGSASLGLFAFVVMQMLIMSVVLTSALYLMRRWGAKRWIRLLIMAVFCFGPYFAGYAAFPIKDYLYTAFLLAMVLMIMAFIRDPGTFREGKKCWFLSLCWIVCCSLMMLIRNNGPYIYYGMLILLIPAIVRLCRERPGAVCFENKNISSTGAVSMKAEEDNDKEPLSGCCSAKKNESELGEAADSVGNKSGHIVSRIFRNSRFVFVVLLCLLLPIGIYKGTETAITIAYNVEKDSPKEMLSIFFQQTARYVREYGDEVTEEEREAIDAVLDYDSLAEIYMESLSDPVKTTYHASDTGDLVRYFKVWFAQFLKHPLCYVEATWNQNYYLFAPWANIVIFNQDSLVGEEMIDGAGVYADEIREWLNFEIPDVLEGFGVTFVSWYTLLTTIPVIGLFSNIGFYVILMCTLLVFFFADGRGREAKVMIPVVLSFFIVILAPGILIHPRYAFPIIYCMPSVIAFYQSGCSKKTDIESQQFKETVES